MKKTAESSMPTQPAPRAGECEDYNGALAMNAALPSALLLLGPTASGKTACALALAERLPVEIISVDSALIYRDMDIGTAKPTAAEQAACPHHLIDMVSPEESYSAARFREDARRSARPSAPRDRAAGRSQA